MLQVESSKKDQKTEMLRLLDTYQKTALHNEKIVKSNLDQQLKKLRERVIQRSTTKSQDFRLLICLNRTAELPCTDYEYI